MTPQHGAIAQRALDALPDVLAEREIVQSLARRLAFEILNYGSGTIPMQSTSPDGSGILEMICEDLETALLLSDDLATQADEAEEITPEERMKRVLDKAEQVKSDLAAGMSLQEAIRRELADTDCGACDHPTCDLYSIALANGSDDDNTKCEPGGPKVTAQVELVMEVGKGASVDTDKIIAIEDLAADDGKREGGLEVLEIGTGNGFSAIVGAAIYPDVNFTIIEPDLRRVWFLKRLINLLGIRNGKVLAGRPEHYLNEYEGGFDMVLIKHLEPTDAFPLGLAFARPEGKIVSCQDADWSDRAALYQRHGHGRSLPLLRPLEFSAAPIDGHVLLSVARPKSEDDEVAADSGGESVAV